MTFRFLSVCLPVLLSLAGALLAAEDAAKAPDTAVEQTASAEPLTTRTFKVPPDVLNWKPKGVTVEASRKRTVREMLEAFGVTFPTGATAFLNAATSQLVVKNTKTNLDLVEILVETAGHQVPASVQLTTRVAVFDPKEANAFLRETPVPPEGMAPALPSRAVAPWTLAGVFTPSQQEALLAWLEKVANAPRDTGKEDTGKVAAAPPFLPKGVPPKPLAIFSLPATAIPNGSEGTAEKIKPLPGERSGAEKGDAVVAGLSVAAYAAVGPDGCTVDLSLAPRAGGPTGWKGTNHENPEYQAEAAYPKSVARTAVTIWDGQTVAMKGDVYLPEFLIHPEKEGKEAFLAKPYKVLLLVTAQMVMTTGEPFKPEARARVQVLGAVRLPLWNLKEAPLSEAIRALMAMSKRFDAPQSQATILLQNAEAGGSLITLHLHDFTVEEAVRHLAHASGLEVEKENNTYRLVTKP